MCPKDEVGHLRRVWPVRSHRARIDGGAVRKGRERALRLIKPAAGGAEQANEADNDEIDGHDVIQHPGHHKDENARQKRDERRQTELQIHSISSCLRQWLRALDATNSSCVET